MCARILEPVGRLISAKTQQRFEGLIRKQREFAQMFSGRDLSDRGVRTDL